VRLLDCEDLEDVGVQGLLVNAYHVFLRPGCDLVASVGGLHEFMGWHRAILTDSGGFQAMTLGGRVSADGIAFKSIYDGTAHLLTPERAIEIQLELGADIVVALDVCPRLPAPADSVRQATELTMEWAERCIELFSRRQPTQQILTGIVQGGTDPDLRTRCAEALVKMGFSAYAVGGLSVGESREERNAVLELMDDVLPRDRLRYLMGVGDPVGIFEAVVRGMDLFDCVLPTRLGRHGVALTAKGRLNLRSASVAKSDAPIESDCGCQACSRYSRSYLRHLLLVGEETGRRLVSFHNLWYLNRFLEDIRRAISTGRLAQLGETLREAWGA
jgi:queuine tRNA-ribosyltransferase